MKEIQYVGEHLLPGKIGHFFIVLAFVSAILSALAYFMATRNREKSDAISWRNIGRVSFGIHALSIFSIIGTIFYVMTNKYFEYHYAWEHVSEELPFKYIFAAFWEGQEGSFLLWMFWHVVLGLILMRTDKTWESPVISILSLIQVFVSSMILGLYWGFGEHVSKIGSNPLLLLRQGMEAPIFSRPDYLTMISGNGLNPLLQNYWMTIHPPTLFLGFASTAIPFCFAIAGLWLGKHKEWLKPALSWSLFSGAILGTGILMGGAWAYEALSFGGYWAWDPVENMSLVPWLVMLAGIHTNVISKSTGYSIKSTYLFYLLSFVLVVYSTFLTRSGILGDTSVHAFTEMGLEWQLVIFIGFFTLLSASIFLSKQKSIPSPEKEEAISSREFWMFIGTLILLFSSVLITFTTSIPVYNKIFDWFGTLIHSDLSSWRRTAPLDPVSHYNKYQLWIGVFIGILTGLTQFLRYREFNWGSQQNKFLRHSAITLLVAVVLTYLTSLWIELKAWQNVLLLFAGVYAVTTNTDYLITYIKGNLKIAGSSFSHIGFGIMLVGIIASGLNKYHISSNVFAQEGLIENFSLEDYKKNILLMRDEPMYMNGYLVTYISDTTMGHNREFKVHYQQLDQKGKAVSSFDLFPNVIYSKEFDKIAATNPSTKHYLGKDIFTHIASLPKAEMDPNYRQQLEDSLKYKDFALAKGDTLFGSRYYAILEDITYHPDNVHYKPEPEDIAIGVKLAFKNYRNDSTLYANPIVINRKGDILYYPDAIPKLGLSIRLNLNSYLKMVDQEKNRQFEKLTFKKGEVHTLNGKEILFAGFNREASHPDFQQQEGDLAVGARLQVKDKSGNILEAQPLYVIRNSKVITYDAQIPEAGLYFRFAGIDPKNETIDIQVSQSVKPLQVSFQMAENVPRNDYIVMEAIVFPGINLFWVGAIMMMAGLLIGMIRRIREV